MRSFRKTRLGFTLTEVAIVMGIIGVLLGTLWAAAGSVNEANRIRNASETIVKIAQNVRLLYIERSAFTNGQNHDLTSMLINSAVFPDDTISPVSGLPVTPWSTGIQVRVGPSLSGSGPSNSFDLILQGNLPEDDCKKLASMMIGPGREPALVSVELNGTTIDIETASLGDYAGNNCTTATFRFGLK